MSWLQKYLILVVLVCGLVVLCQESKASNVEYANHLVADGVQIVLLYDSTLGSPLDTSNQYYNESNQDEINRHREQP